MAVPELSSDALANIFAHMWDRSAMGASCAVNLQWHQLASERLSSWDAQRLAHMVETVPQCTAVRFMRGRHQSILARTAERYGRDGNSPSVAYCNAGIKDLTTLKEFDHKHSAVVELPGGRATVAPLHDFQIVNAELFAMLVRASRKLDRVAMIVLAECLTEGKGGLHQCLFEGTYWYGFAAALHHPFATTWDQYTRGNKAISVSDIEAPDFETLAEAEAYFAHYEEEDSDDEASDGCEDDEDEAEEDDDDEEEEEGDDEEEAGPR
jgi:hypothetical protein